MTETKTTSEKTAADVAALLRARNPLLWIVTAEEPRAERYLIEAAKAANYLPHFWDIAQGVTEIDGSAPRPRIVNTPDPGELFTFILGKANMREPEDKNDIGTERDRRTRDVWIMRDLPPWLQGIPGAGPLRQLRNLVRFVPGTSRPAAQAVIVLTTDATVPPELRNHATVVNWPMPDRAEIASVLDAALEKLPDDLKATAATNGTREAAIDAAVGLSGEEAAATFAKSLVKLRKIDPAEVSEEKRRIVARSKGLTFEKAKPEGMAGIGGLENLKAWLQTRRNAYTPQARAYGLPKPKGVLIVGVAGTGKSLTAQCTAAAWGIPLLRWDLNAGKGKFVGESEANIRQNLETIKASGRVVVWIDEIEKALQGATSGSSDGGVSADALGTFLSWMQDRDSEAFVIATANDISALPPEMLRKGRWDELFFVDLPTRTERAAIVKAALRANGRAETIIDAQLIADNAQGFVGAEIAAAIPEAMFTAFNDNGREIETGDVLSAIRATVPLSKTAGPKVEALRAWGQANARPASLPEAQEPALKAVSGSSRIDL